MTFAIVPVLMGLSIAVVPSGWAGVRVNQFAGARPGTLYPGVHWIVPLIDGLMNVAIPGAFLAGSLAPAYDRLSTLLDRQAEKIQGVLDLSGGYAVNIKDGLNVTGADGTGPGTINDTGT